MSFSCRRGRSVLPAAAPSDWLPCCERPWDKSAAAFAEWERADWNDDRLAEECARLRVENDRLRKALKSLAGCDDMQVDLIATTDG